MNPYYSDDAIRIYHGDALEVLKTLPDNHVNCVVTSPPYWGLRDYGVDGQLGLEASPWQYLENMVEVFREVKRVLRDDGTLWLNMGDSYAGSRKGGNNGFGSSTLNGSSQSHDESHKAMDKMRTVSRRRDDEEIPRSDLAIPGLKPKDLVGMPWRLAFALQADGWYLRQDIVWHKPNPMPESVRDRCTKAHEYLFLLSKSERYYYNWNAVLEPATGNAHPRGHGVNPKAVAGWQQGPGSHKPVEFAKVNNDRHGKLLQAPRSKQNPSFSAAITENVDERNKRSVWTVVTESFDEAHFATFPTELVKPCILAGCPQGGIVLDPFAGSGTTLLVAQELQCQGWGIELNAEYIDLSLRARLPQRTLNFATGQ